MRASSCPTSGSGMIFSEPMSEKVVAELNADRRVYRRSG
jgi:hypothetical protein